MKKNIKYLSRECCQNLLSSLGELNQIKKYKRGFELEEFDFIDGISPANINSQIVLDPSPKADFENSKLVFEELKNLDLVQANDQRLWVTLTHITFFDYTFSRWDENKEWSKRKIQDRFHFLGGKIDTRVRNALSRLWWAARITYDETREDPYELTKLLWETQDIFQGLLERKYGAYPQVVKGFLEFYRRNKQLKQNEIRTIFSGLNSIGGVKHLPLLDSKDIMLEIANISNFRNIKFNL